MLSEGLDLKNEFSIIFEETRKKLNEISKENEKQAEEVDKKWIDKLSSKCVLKTDKKVRTAREAISAAKAQRNIILKKLADEKLDLSTQNKLSEDLIYLNNVILSYQDEFDRKNDIKKEILCVKTNEKKAYVVKEAIEASIGVIEKQINEINNFLINNSIIECKNNEELKKLTIKAREKIELKKLKDDLEKILTYNAYSYNSFSSKDLIDSLPIKFKTIVSNWFILMNNNSINMGILKKPDDDNSDSLSAINYYLDLAKNNKDKEALDVAVNLIKKLNDEDLKNDLMAEAAEIGSKITKNHFKSDLKKAEELVEIAEKTEKSTDFIKAEKFMRNFSKITDKLEISKRNELANRLLKLGEKNSKRFDELMLEIKDKLVNDIEVENNLLDEFFDRYNYLDNTSLNEVKEDYDTIIKIYNNRRQSEYQKTLKKEDIKKYTIADIFREMTGGIINFASSTKLIKRIARKRLKALQKKYIKAEEFEKEELKENMEKVNKFISESDIVNGLRLFVARNRLSKSKIKLYKEGISNKGFKQDPEDEDKILYQTRATNNISKLLKSGLTKKIKDETIEENKSRIFAILDQYLELISSGTYDKDNVTIAYDYLNSIKDNISLSEYFGYLDEIRMIDEFRASNNGMPYHLNNNEDFNEVDEVISYYDKDDYDRISRYVKRKY